MIMKRKPPVGVTLLGFSVGKNLRGCKPFHGGDDTWLLVSVEKRVDDDIETSRQLLMIDEALISIWQAELRGNVICYQKSSSEAECSGSSGAYFPPLEMLLSLL